MAKINEDDSPGGLFSDSYSFGDQFLDEFNNIRDCITSNHCCKRLFGDELEGELMANDTVKDPFDNICYDCLLGELFKRESALDKNSESGMVNTTSIKICDTCRNESGLCKCMSSILRNHCLFRGNFENQSTIYESGDDAADGIRCIDCLARGINISDALPGSESSKCLIDGTFTNESGLSKSREDAMASIVCTKCLFRDVLADELSDYDALFGVICSKCMIHNKSDSNENYTIPSFVCLKCLIRNNIIKKSILNENDSNAVPNIAFREVLLPNTNCSDLNKGMDDVIANIGCIKCFIRDIYTNKSGLSISREDALPNIVCLKCFTRESVLNKTGNDTQANLTCTKCLLHNENIGRGEDASVLNKTGNDTQANFACSKCLLHNENIGRGEDASGMNKIIEETVPNILCSKCMLRDKSGNDSTINNKCLFGEHFNNEAAINRNERVPPNDVCCKNSVCSGANESNIDKSRGDALTNLVCSRCMRESFANKSVLPMSWEDDISRVDCNDCLVVNKSGKTIDIECSKCMLDKKKMNVNCSYSNLKKEMILQEDQILHDINSKISSAVHEPTASCSPCKECSFVKHATSCEEFVLNGLHSYFRVMDSLLVEGAIGAVKALSFVCDIITFPVYLVLQRPWQKKQLSRRTKAKSTTEDKSTVVVHNVDGPRDVHCKMLAFGVDTMDKILAYVVKQFPRKHCLGTRQILSEEDELQPNGRIFKKYIMGDYKWRTYEDLNREASNFGRGLRAIGHQPKQNVVIFAETRAEWMVTAHACFKQNFPVVTLYATLGEDAIAHGINETEVNIVITSHDLLPKFKKILSKTPRVQTIVFFEDQLTGTDTKGFKPGVQLIPYKEVINKGNNTSPQLDALPPKKDDVAIIMYTSGSTGVPKGVLLTHSNMMATIGGFSDAIRIYSQDIFLGFLPLAHVFELLAESVCILNGVPIGYSTPLTMIDSSSKIKKGSKGDASVLHPTCLTAVPLILDRIYKGINDKVEKSSPLRRALFDFAFNYKKKWIRRGFSCPLIDKFIFGATRAMLGGNVRLIMTGGAPLSPDTHELVKICLCERVIQGYGLTETTSCATIMDHFDRSTGRAGVAATVCDVKLVNWDEGNYKVTDKPYPRGEIYVGGSNISPGYYKMPEKTKEDFFDQDGKRWFKTGDIGELHPDGSIKIIDRKKDLVKLQAGEYVSLGKVESELKTCPIVENICVYGDSAKDYCVALVVPNPNHLEAMAVRLGLPATIPFESLCADPQIEKAVLAELAEHGKKCKLEKFEIPAAVKLCTEVWSPDMGLVTAAFKLKRKDIQQRYQHEINRMYGAS